MRKFLKNRKGMTLATVIIIISVLIILCGVLSEAVMSNIVLTKRHRNIDMAYYAGESAIEHWSSIINKTANDQSVVSGSNVDLGNTTSVENYISYLIGEFNSAISSASSTTMNIDIEGDGVDLAKVQLDDIEKVSYSVSANDLIIDLGIRAISEYAPSSTNYSTGNKVVYAIKRFTVTYPVQDNLDSAIYAVGDIHVTGTAGHNNPAIVKGDVYTYGSFAKYTLTNNQYLYGGLMAQKYGKIQIFGNAYSRSFIRTGVYNEVQAENNSEIFIFKDAIAQCIQSFGINNKLVVLRNAYTFDDVEMNGSNSVIAINGSVFGLSRGGANPNHDESSGIINSAPIHGQLSPNSLKSRIVVNGDVILAGGTFKVNEATGEALAQIEDASVAWDTDEDIPYYKLYSKWTEANADIYHEDIRSDYKLSKISSLLNQFQVWNIVDPSNPTEISDWLSYIDRERQYGFEIGTNKAGHYQKSENDYKPLRGFSFFEMAANNKLYVSRADDNSAQYYFSDDLYVKDSGGSSSPLKPYRLDNIFNPDNTLKYDKDAWDGFTISVARDFLNTSNSKVADIHNDLINKVHKYATRIYPSAAGDPWTSASLNKFDETLKKLATRYNEVYTTNAGKYYFYIDPTATGLSGEMDIKDIFNSSYFDYNIGSDNKKIVDIYTTCNDRSKYYLLVNTKPDLDIVIDGTFNGIIVTAGKVRLKPKADIFGSIIAAGGGGYTSGEFRPSLHAVENGDEGRLNNGDYAAVKIESSDEGGPKVDFFLGLVNDATKSHDLVNVVTTAYNTIEGKNMIPSSMTFNTMSIDEKLAYLNKSARVNLLKKLKDEGINLFDIF